MLRYESTSHAWNPAELLHNLTPADVLAHTDDSDALREKLWEDMTSEYDAENFCLELERLERAGVRYSPELWSFEKVWRRDEFNHYLGFRRLYALATGEDEAELHTQMQRRAGDFTNFGDYLRDEFKLCLLLAYDELSTTRFYALDVPWYKAFDRPALVNWIDRIRADEAMHYKNALRVAQTRWRDRLGEAPTIIEDILRLDLNAGAYNATFILDHTGGHYTPELLRGVADTLLNVIARQRA